jgi:hypothetical protein
MSLFALDARRRVIESCHVQILMLDHIAQAKPVRSAWKSDQIGVTHQVSL